MNRPSSFLIRLSITLSPGTATTIVRLRRPDNLSLASTSMYRFFPVTIWLLDFFISNASYRLFVCCVFLNHWYDFLLSVILVPWNWQASEAYIRCPYSPQAEVLFLDPY